MIKFYPHLTTSISEINKKPTIILHSICGCNLRCYQCCNYKDIVQYNQEVYWTIDDICSAIKKCKGIYEYIVFSGGEFLLNSYEDIRQTIKRIREICDLPIILYTNGILKEKLQNLGAESDGIHMDWKLPFQLIDPNDKECCELMEFAIGRNLDKNEICDLIDNLQYVIQTDKGLSQIRSVEYPFLNASSFEANAKYIEELNSKFGKNTIYEIHKFIPID